jgi:hypothetical protein
MKIYLSQVRWEGGGTESEDECTFFCGKGIENHELGTGFFFLHKRIISVVRMVEFISERMVFRILRGRWCDIIVLKVHAPTEDKTDDAASMMNWNAYLINYLNTI